MSTGTAPTMPMSSTSAAGPSGPVPAAAPATGAAAAAKGPAPSAASAKKSNAPMLAGVGALIVILAVVAFMMFRPPATPTEQAQVTPPSDIPLPPAEGTPPPADTTGTTPPGADTQAAQGAGVAAGTPPPAAPPAGTATGGAGTSQAGATGSSAAATGAAGGTTTPPASTTKPAAQPGTATPPGTAPTAARGATPPGAATPPIDDSLVGFGNVKVQIVTGRNSKDEDVLLNFGGGQIAVLPRSGGAALTSLGYRDVARATYVKARNPKWNASLPGPPENLDVGSFLRTSRHWLVLQTAGTFIILRLEDDNFARVIEAIEARTGLKVDRPTGDEKGV